MSKRVEQVSELIKRELSAQIREILSEDFGIVSITDVNIGADFKNAEVFVSSLNEAKLNEAVRILNSHAQNLQSMLGRKLVMKYTPKLVFKPNFFQEELNKVEELLDKVIK